VNLSPSPKLFTCYLSFSNSYSSSRDAGVLIFKPSFKSPADEDQVVGVIAGSAERQRSNRSPITIPNSESLRYSG
jgi:acyl transferase domain-containing protein